MTMAKCGNYTLCQSCTRKIQDPGFSNLAVPLDVAQSSTSRSGCHVNAAAAVNRCWLAHSFGYLIST